MIDGYDVSVYQATTPALDQVEFLIARATYGTLADPRTAQHVGRARAEGKVTGVYAFGRHGHVADQVDALRTVVDRVGPVDLVALDLESDGGNPPMSSAEAREFVADVPGCGLYASTSRYVDVGQRWRWVADYRGHEPPIPWDVWQWTSFAGGVHLDRNRFRGTVDELRALGGQRMDTTITVLPWGGQLTIAAGATPTGIKLAPDGRIVERKTWTAIDRPSGAPYDAIVTTSPADVVRGDPFLRVVAGFFDGFLVSTGQVTFRDNPPPAVDLSVERERVKRAAIEAIGRIT